jgi:hypothetical protein
MLRQVVQGIGINMIFTSKIVVTRKKWTAYGSLASGTFKGSGYCEEHYDRQYLIKEWRFYGFRVWSRILDYEDVPAFASIQLSTVGYTEWESKFAKCDKASHIDQN